MTCAGPWNRAAVFQSYPRLRAQGEVTVPMERRQGCVRHSGLSYLWAHPCTKSHTSKGPAGLHHSHQPLLRGNTWPERDRETAASRMYCLAMALPTQEPTHPFPSMLSLHIHPAHSLTHVQVSVQMSPEFPLGPASTILTKTMAPPPLHKPWPPAAPPCILLLCGPRHTLRHNIHHLRDYCPSLDDSVSALGWAYFVFWPGSSLAQS
jgi:hypothetical protein